MDLHLNDKTASSTGSTAGIASRSARKLAVEGAKVIITGRNKAKLDQAIDSIAPPAARSPGAYWLMLDRGRARAALVRASREWNILVTISGLYEMKEFAAITDADWAPLLRGQRLSGVALAGPISQAWLERNWGRIIFISVNRPQPAVVSPNGAAPSCRRGVTPRSARS